MYWGDDRLTLPAHRTTGCIGLRDLPTPCKPPHDPTKSNGLGAIESRTSKCGSLCTPASRSKLQGTANWNARSFGRWCGWKIHQTPLIRCKNAINYKPWCCHDCLEKSRNSTIRTISSLTCHEPGPNRICNSSPQSSKVPKSSLRNLLDRGLKWAPFLQWFCRGIFFGIGPIQNIQKVTDSGTFWSGRVGRDLLQVGYLLILFTYVRFFHFMFFHVFSHDVYRSQPRSSEPAAIRTTYSKWMSWPSQNVLRDSGEVIASRQKKNGELSGVHRC